MRISLIPVKAERGRLGPHADLQLADRVVFLLANQLHERFLSRNIIYIRSQNRFRRRAVQCSHLTWCAPDRLRSMKEFERSARQVE